MHIGVNDSFLQATLAFLTCQKLFFRYFRLRYINLIGDSICIYSVCQKMPILQSFLKASISFIPRKPLRIEKGKLTVKNLPKAMSEFSINCGMGYNEGYTSICPKHFRNNNAATHMEYRASQTKCVRVIKNMIQESDPKDSNLGEIPIVVYKRYSIPQREIHFVSYLFIK